MRNETAASAQQVCIFTAGGGRPEALSYDEQTGESHLGG